MSSGVHRIFYGLFSPGEYYMLSLLRDSIIMSTYLIVTQGLVQ